MQKNLPILSNISKYKFYNIQYFSLYKNSEISFQLFFKDLFNSSNTLNYSQIIIFDIKIYQLVIIYLL